MTKYTTLLFIVAGASAFGQDLYISRNAQISFYSSTPMEDIDAVNNEASSMINTSTGEVVFAVLIKSFRFQKALMEEHFNENYLESSKYPKATFVGKIVEVQSIDFSKDGMHEVTVQGDLTVHGVKKQIAAPAKIVVSGKVITSTAQFYVKPADYQIKIPSLVADKIAETIDVKINCRYDPK